MDIDWIQGYKFIDIADSSYAPTRRARDDYNSLKNTVKKIGGIIYTHTMYIPNLFNLIKKTNNEVIVVSHNSDSSADISPPDNVLQWYSQNVNIKHPRVQSIPLGLENNRWFPHQQKRDKMIRCLSEERKYKNLVYMNHNISNNPDKRIEPYKLLENKAWVTVAYGKNPYEFNEYIQNIYNHKFVISPEGNGIDTVRTWECLYMGTIPIEKRNINNQFYIDLPICFVDSWNQVTENFLLREYERIKALKWNMDKLKFGYWANKIQTHE